MRNLTVFATVAVVLLACSSVSAAWPYGATVVVGSPTVVQSFYPVGPVYAYPAPAVAVAPTVVYRAPVVVAPRTVYRPSVVVAAPAVAVPAPVVVRSKVYVLGQPVRNVVRAVLP